ncbi:glycosyltransferase [Thaumarchaeota archaeon SCGC AB-539-E09]|nr:glycosyltransferase [Thaumarchaeota archaeon SCGC AB-539-E09]
MDSEVFNSDRYDQELLKKRYGLEGRKIVLFVGRLTAQKGLDHLISAIPPIQMAIPESIFLIVGDGPLMNMLRDKSHTMGIENSIKFLGQVEHMNLPELYAMSDMFILPSLSESFPNTMLEAMAMKKPMVISRVGVAPEILRHFKDAILIEPANKDEIMKSIGAILTDAVLSKKLSRNAHELVIREFSWEKVIDKTLEIYRDSLH